jgi:phage portal protein BeeE
LSGIDQLLPILDTILKPFRKSLPTAIGVDTTSVASPAWSIDVINTLDSDYGTLARPYELNPLIAAAIEAMRRNAIKATLQVGYYDDDGGFEPEDHPLLDIWKSPAPGETDATLIEHMYRSLLTSELNGGNAFAQLVPDKAGSAIREIQPIPCEWVGWPVMGEAIGKIEFYPITGSDFGRTWAFVQPAELMLHIKTGISTNGRAYGRTCLDAVKPELALIKLISMYETTVLSRSGVPSFIISLLGTSAQMLSRDQIGVLQGDISRAMSGKSVGKPFVTKGEMKIDTPGFSPRDLSVAEMAELAVARVCGVLGWAPMSLKQPDTGKTYSNLIEANKASWRDAILPFLETVAASLTKAVRTHSWAYDDKFAEPDPYLAVRFDFSQIEELAVDLDKIADRATKLINAKTPIIMVDEARTMLGLAEFTDEQKQEIEDNASGSSADDQNDDLRQPERAEDDSRAE